MESIDNTELQITHEFTPEGYRITVFRASDGMMAFSWLMSGEDAMRFAQQIVNTLAGT